MRACDDLGVHEFSGYTVAGIRKALDALDFSNDVLPLLTQSAREALQNGSLFKFHPGPTMDEVLIVLAKARGEEAVAELMEETTRSSLEGIVAPLARLYLTFKGGDPAALFERFGDLLRGTTRGIVATWKRVSNTSGVMTFEYPVAVDPVVVHGWRGALRHVLHFARVEGQVVGFTADGLSPSVRLDVSWKR